MVVDCAGLAGAKQVLNLALAVTATSYFPHPCCALVVVYEQTPCNDLAAVE